MLDYPQIKIESLSLHEEKETGKFFLEATYLMDSKKGLERIHFPKIYLPVTHCSFAYIKTSSDGVKTIDLGFGELPILEDPEVTMIKEHVYELTVEEIEKLLGYAIKIVSTGKEDES